jgi:hypothetical protein
VFHLLDEDLLVPQTLLENQVLLPLSLQVELEQDLILLFARLCQGFIGKRLDQRLIIISP